MEQTQKTANMKMKQIIYLNKENKIEEKAENF